MRVDCSVSSPSGCAALEPIIHSNHKPTDLLKSEGPARSTSTFSIHRDCLFAHEVKYSLASLCSAAPLLFSDERREPLDSFVARHCEGGLLEHEQT